MGLLSVLFRLIFTIFLVGVAGGIFIVVIGLLAVLTHVPIWSLLCFAAFLLTLVSFVLFGLARVTSILCFAFVVFFAVALGVSFATLDTVYVQENIDAQIRAHAGVALITGSTRGIGFDVAECLIRNNWTVFLHGRSVAAMREAAAKLPQGPGAAVVVEKGAELDSFEQVREFAAAVLKHPQGEKLSAAFFNAGVGYPMKDKSKDGQLDWITQTNYLSHELLFDLLSGPLTRNKGRAVHVSSANGAGATTMGDDDLLDFRRSVAYTDAYGRTKLLQVIGAMAASKRHPKIRVTVEKCIFDFCLVFL